MVPKFFLHLAFVLTFFAPVVSTAQLLHKLQQTAAKAKNLTSRSQPDSPAPGQPAAQPATISKDSGPAAPQPLPDLTTHGVKITVLTGPLPSDRSLLPQCIHIGARDGEIVATTAIDHLSPQSQTSEMREGSPGDEVTLYENGKETGKTTFGALRKEQPSRNNPLAADNWPYAQDIAANGADQLNKTGKYIRTGVGDHHLEKEIAISGKTFGPYMIIDALLVNAAGTRFYAIVTLQKPKGLETWFISDRNKVKLPGIGAHILVNPDMSRACVVQILNMEDVQNRNTDVRELQKLSSEGPAYFIDGTVLAHTVYSDGWLDQTGKNVFGSNNGIYLNGKPISDMPQAAGGNAWCSADASRWAVYNPNDQRLVLSDGTTIAHVSHPVQLQLGGKSLLTWIIVQEGRGAQVLLCSMPL